jgi:methylenetetrahydrofolate dehydrogenase (NADP+)/methenyltetrahydrofolate cyclohydrolase
MSQVLDGTVVRDQILEKLKPRVAHLGRPPGLAVVLVGSDPASEQYVRNKILACQKLGVYSEKITPPANSTTEDMLKVIDQINRNPKIDGMLIQMPLPPQIDVRRVLEAVDPEKDADGFHPLNVGHMVAGRPAPRPCTPSGIIEILKHYRVKMEGRKAVVLGRSDIVGKPMALMLLQENATVTICHSRTINLEDECRAADILVTAMGKPAMITTDFIAPGATVVDVGTTRVSDRDEAIRLGKGEEFVKKGAIFVGDVNPVDVRHCAGAHTPVPGGVGPLTIAMLMSNTVMLAEQRQGLREAVRVSA